MGRSFEVGIVRRWLTAVGFVLAALAFGGCEQTQHTEGSKEQAAPIKAPIWPSGTRSTYELELSNRFAVAGNQMVGFELSSDFALDSQQMGSQKAELVATLTSPTFKAADPGAQQQYDQLAVELQKPFGLTLQSGVLTEIKAQPQASPFASSIIRTLAASVQVAGQPQGGAGKWSARENDATGSYMAEYSLLDAPGRLGKRKVQYDTLKIGQLSIATVAPQVTPEVVSSKGEVTLVPATGEQWLLHSVTYEDELKTSLAPTSALVSNTKVKLVLRERAQPKPGLDAAVALAGARAAAPSLQSRGAVPAANFDAARIGDYTFNSAVKELEEQAKNPKKKLLVDKVGDKPLEPETLASREAMLAEHGRVFTALAALLRQNPQHLGDVVKRARGGSPATQALLDALASAGTPDAQAALIQLMNSTSATGPLRRAAAASLIRTPEPTPATVAALATHTDPADPLRVHALYGLGTMARLLRERGEADRSRTIGGILVQQLHRADSASEQVDALRGIANSGDPAAFEAVQPYLDSTTRKVKVAAVDALRLMQHPQVDALVAERLLSPVADVQRAALDAISVRQPNDVLAAGLLKVLVSSSAAGVRIVAVRVAERWLPQRPELRVTLEKLASSDATEQIKQAARAALGR